MTYVVNDACIRCKYMDCVEVCPVDCFYEGENNARHQPQRVHRLRRVRARMPARRSCPIRERLEQWLSSNTTFSAQWPNVTRKLDQTPPDADAMKGVENKYEQFFSPEPARATERANHVGGLGGKSARLA